VAAGHRLRESVYAGLAHRLRRPGVAYRALAGDARSKTLEEATKHSANILATPCHSPLDGVVILAELGMLERTEGGGVLCPYSSIHIDMNLKTA
jgi:hypothetical protein